MAQGGEDANSLHRIAKQTRAQGANANEGIQGGASSCEWVVAGRVCFLLNGTLMHTTPPGGGGSGTDCQIATCLNKKTFIKRVGARALRGPYL